ncbi:type II secretion system F family protein [Desulfocurvibacter africanus]|uniref:Type II secretion system F domain-containing protein n=1 Tax=Desulfocurvibacter africanus subsp. africanus str. Walvis Bay TaxID=690850 RepID=F3YUY9_DESAF|nr:type II secretion system F family protein [Desulfocurvibacter africanus]EGJ49239.1 Type II secretion system F domain-containing protein [Desulfocurvibacter africanus subsp. africanus str. Walvis Bay]
MQDYSYTAIDQNGARVTGRISAANAAEAMEIVAAKGLIPAGVRSGTDWNPLAGLLGGFLSGIKAGELILFTKQLKTMFVAGVPVLTLFEVLEEQATNPRLKRVVAGLQQDVRAGRTLHEAFSSHPRIFSPLYCSMVRAGEVSGRLGDVLDRLIRLLQHEHRIKSDIRSALRYPMFVLATLTASFFFLLTTVVPKFMGFFDKLGLELPLPTRICITLYQLISNYWPMLLALLVLAVVGLHAALRTRRGSYIKDALLLTLPLIGPVLQKAAMSRFASTFAILQASGVSVLESLGILAGTIGNSAVSQEFERLKEQLQQGRGIAAPLRQARFFTPMVVNMVAIGEESGNLEEMLRDVSSHYDEEVGYAVAAMSQAIGPLLMICMAGVVGFFAMAIFMPMWDLTKMVR